MVLGKVHRVHIVVAGKGGAGNIPAAAQRHIHAGCYLHHTVRILYRPADGGLQPYFRIQGSGGHPAIKAQLLQGLVGAAGGMLIGAVRRGEDGCHQSEILRNHCPYGLIALRSRRPLDGDGDVRVLDLGPLGAGRVKYILPPGGPRFPRGLPEVLCFGLRPAPGQQQNAQRGGENTA